MLTITIPAAELYDEAKNEFFSLNAYSLRLEHSLVSLSKWEAKWNKPFLSKEDKSWSESVDYIRCMTLNQNVPEDVYGRLTPALIRQVSEYINLPMTATTFSGSSRKRTVRSEIVTAEIIYYWMIALQIPSDYQKWHLNRLLALIEVCSEKNKPPKRMSRSEIFAQNRVMNAARLKKFNTRG